MLLNYLLFIAGFFIVFILITVFSICKAAGDADKREDEIAFYIIKMI